jgi:hypothetical protein
MSVFILRVWRMPRRINYGKSGVNNVDNEYWEEYADFKSCTISDAIVLHNILFICGLRILTEYGYCFHYSIVLLSNYTCRIYSFKETIIIELILL